MILVWLKCLRYLHVSHVPEMLSLVGFSQALRGFYLHPLLTLCSLVVSPGTGHWKVRQPYMTSGPVSPMEALLGHSSRLSSPTSYHSSYPPPPPLVSWSPYFSLHLVWKAEIVRLLRTSFYHHLVTYVSQPRVRLTK